MARFTVLLHPTDAGGYAAEVPGLGFTTDGTTVDHALATAKEAALGRIALMVEQRDLIVPERVPPIIARIDIDVPAEIDGPADVPEPTRADRDDYQRLLLAVRGHALARRRVAV